MRIKRWWVAAGVPVALMTFGLGYFVFYGDESDPISYDSYAKIQIGMSSTEVHELLGPQCYYVDGRTWTVICSKRAPSPELTDEWGGRNNNITVTFRDGVVVRKSIENTSIRNFIGRVTRCFGLTEPTFTTIGAVGD